MNREVTNIANRLSLRPPQRRGLEILARAADLVPMRKTALDELPAIEAAVRAELPDLEAFERDFPSLCFALATGVGKTRLMGAFVAYLHAVKGVRHFFVLAPGKTIYEKLVADFTPGTPKYVLQGLAEFAVTPPRVITGDNYEQIAAAGHVGSGTAQQRLLVDQVEINVFNIDKLNKDTSVRGGQPRIKKLREILGESYFDYLAGLDDLVLLMDESHHYRADAGMRALNELRPVFGLELTATPYVETGRASVDRVKFKNVVYSYPLHRALDDGFIKEPAVATRKDFDPRGLSEEEIEQIKLEDAVHVHESVKVELDVYARQTGAKRVKPFILVIAQTIEHAGSLKAMIASDAFFAGRYRDRVIEVHGNQTGQEKEDVVARLLKVEDPDEPTEIVIHVNKLKEGWDVTNLYTIVPLRAANSKNLIEQSIGRGLRLPFGRRTGVAALDRLTIIAHDRFQELLDEAGKPSSIIRSGYEIGGEGTAVGLQAVVVPTRMETELFGTTTLVTHADGRVVTVDGAAPTTASAGTPLSRAALQLAREATEAVAGNPYVVPVVQALPGARETILGWARTHATAEQIALPGFEQALDDAATKVIATYTAGTIGIPRITVVPVGEVTCTYRPFELDLSVFRRPPVDKAVLVQHLRDPSVRDELGIFEDGFTEPHPRNYIVRGLMQCDDIDYDAHAALLNGLADRVLEHLRGYLSNDDEVENVVRYFQRDLVRIVHEQLARHADLSATAYEARVHQGIQSFGAMAMKVPSGETPLPFRSPVADLQSIKSRYFGGFRKCLYEIQQFDSDSERRLSVILEDDVAVLRWLKPPRGRDQFNIFLSTGERYFPDFVVETADAKFVIEVKRVDQLDLPMVQEKARVAVLWCSRATDHELANAGKPWRYVLMPHDAIAGQMTLGALASRYGKS